MILDPTMGSDGPRTETSRPAGASMQGLTPETLAEGKRLLADSDNSTGENWMAEEEALRVWMYANRHALLAAAESVGKLEQQQDWVIDTNYPCMGREIRPDSLVGIMDTSGDLVMALPLEDAQMVIERIQSLRAQLTAIGKALRAYPDSDLASLAETVATRNETLEAQLTAREQERQAAENEASAALRYGSAAIERATAAEAEVERLTNLVQSFFPALIESVPSVGWRCRICGALVPQYPNLAGHTGGCPIPNWKTAVRKAALAPSQPPQTTETRG